MCKDLTKCIICGDKAEVHHVMSNIYRKKSTKYGLVVGLCPFHHRTSKYAVHNDREFSDMLRKEAQIRFEEKYGHDLWIREFHKNYL